MIGRAEWDPVMKSAGQFNQQWHPWLWLFDQIVSAPTGVQHVKENGTLSFACKGITTNGNPACPLLPHLSVPEHGERGHRNRQRPLNLTWTICVPVMTIMTLTLN